MRLSRDDAAPLWVQLRNQMEEAINTGVLSSTSRIPSEQAYMGRGVSANGEVEPNITNTGLLSGGWVDLGVTKGERSWIILEKTFAQAVNLSPSWGVLPMSAQKGMM